jgi:hypothetical protein
MHRARLNRIQFIQDLLRMGHQPTFEELMQKIADSFGPVKTRMLRSDLHFLRTEGINGQPLSIKVVHQKYRLENTIDFSIHSLKDNERGTLPLLFAILKPYQQFPAVEALLTNLIKVHRLSTAEVKQLTWGMGGTETTLTPRFVQRVIDILGCINKQVAIEFNYHKVTEGAVHEKNDTIVYRQVFPIQVRHFEGRYYLVGIQVGKDICPENIQHFPIDRMHRRVDIAYDEFTEEPLTFNWEDMVERTQFAHHYTHCIGMYREFGKSVAPEYVYRWFSGWAASQVQAVPLHHSQEIVQRNGGNIRIRLYVYPTPDVANVFLKFGAHCWE